MHIAEESASCFGITEITQVELKDNRIQTMVEVYERQLNIWKDQNWNSIDGMYYIRESLDKLLLNSLQAP